MTWMQVDSGTLLFSLWLGEFFIADICHNLAINSTVNIDALLEPIVTIADFRKSLKNSRPTVNASELIRQQKFTEEFGQEG
jgi:SpoVK/Ycf46/Vps4 family AAA+-type ATPase